MDHSKPFELPQHLYKALKPIFLQPESFRPVGPWPSDLEPLTCDPALNFLPGSQPISIHGKSLG